MDISLHNTATREKERFTPITEGQVRMYSCGPTVYGRAHLGNMRSFLLSDLIRRMFEYNDYEVTQVINITDVGHLTSDADEGEDKMESAARTQKKSAQEIAVHYTNLFFQDIGALGINTERTIFPRATEHIQEQIALVQKLEEKGYTYATSDGIYFDTSKFPSYPNFAHLDVSGLKEGARIAAGEKHNPTDFALWKFSPQSADTKREQEWDSPWGVGFPGWHLECSAMSMRYLGETFDIHSGGVDHIQVHHTNEIAQSQAATGKPLAHFWLHNEFMLVDGAKMSKSLSNTFSIDDLVAKQISPLVFRYWILTAHYRTLINFTWGTIQGASQALMRLYRSVASLPTTTGTIPHTYAERFLGHVNDDLDTPGAMALVWELLRDQAVSDADKYAALTHFDTVLGLDLKNASHYLTENEHVIPTEELPAEVRALLREREHARKTAQWQRADEYRAQIEALGFDLQDSPSGPKVKRK